MEQTRKQLKLSSIAGITMLNIIFGFFIKDTNNVEIPTGPPQNILLVIKIVLAVMSFAMLLPHLYIGVKGIKWAKDPDSSKGHIIWGAILFLFAVISLVHPILALIKLEEVFANVAAFLSVFAEAAILWNYVKYSSIVSKGNLGGDKP